LAWSAKTLEVTSRNFLQFSPEIVRSSLNVGFILSSTVQGCNWKVESAQYDPELAWREVRRKVEISLLYVGNHDDTGSIVTISKEIS
jgi:hypothetical protein